MPNVLTGSEKNLIRKLHESQYFIEQVVENSPDIIYVLDLAKNKFTFASKRIEEVLGPDNLNMEKIHPFDYRYRAQHIRECSALKKSGSKDIQIRMLNKNGTWNWFQIRDVAFMFDEHGYATHTMGFVRDIQNDKLREERLVHDQNLLKGLTDSENVGISIYKAIRNHNKEIIDFEFVLTTKAFEDFHGRTNFTGKWVFEEFPEVRPAQYDNWRRIVDNNEASSQVSSFAHPRTGKIHWFSLNYEKFGDGFIVSWQDVTEIRAAQETLCATQNMLMAVFNASPIKISVLEAVRNARGEIIDFKYLLCNHNQCTVGETLSQRYPDLSSGIIRHFISVVESGKTSCWQQQFRGDGLDSLYYIQAAKLNDGVVSASIDLYENFPQPKVNEQL